MRSEKTEAESWEHIAAENYRQWEKADAEVERLRAEKSELEERILSFGHPVPALNAEVERLRKTNNAQVQRIWQLNDEVERLRAENKELRFSEQLLQADYRRIEEAAREFFETWDVGRRGAALRAALEEK